MSTSLLSTERRLVTIFVAGAFLFLLIFEGVFLLSRVFLEDRYSAAQFVDDITRVERRGPAGNGAFTGETRRTTRPPSGLGFLILESDGAISGGQFGPEMEVKEVISSLDSKFLEILPVERLRKIDGTLYYKRAMNDDSGQYRIFIRKAGYPIDDILRDIFRFLALDFLILVPFYFMGRYFVRETLEPVERNIDTMNHFIHDAGHELKTPLAIVSGNLQLIRDTKKQDPHLIEESIATIMGMVGSLDGLLELSKLSGERGKEKIRLASQVEEEMRKYTHLIEKKGIVLKQSIPEDVRVTMDAKHFSLLFGNILKNAIKYNKEGGEIEVTWKNGSLAIRDTGEGIEEKDLEKIWERFYRADRSGKHSGAGIGLSIVDRIVKLYDLDVRVESEKGVGTTFTLREKKWKKSKNS